MSDFKRFEAYVRSDVFAGPPDPEDGHRPDELAYYIVCEDEQGRRWRSVWTRTTMELRRTECEAAAAAHLWRVRVALAEGADPRRSLLWRADRPAYGSPAWTPDVEAAEAAREKAEDLATWH